MPRQPARGCAALRGGGDAPPPDGPEAQSLHAQLKMGELNESSECAIPPPPPEPPTAEQVSAEVTTGLSGQRGAFFEDFQRQVQGDNPWLSRMRERLQDKNLRRVFRKLDKTKRGYLKAEDLREAMLAMQIPVPEEEFGLFFKSLDILNDDRVSYKEFKIAMRRADFINQLQIYARATLSFAAVVLFWNGVYDGGAMLPLDMLKDVFIKGDRTQGPGFMQARGMELLVGFLQSSTSFWFLLKSKDFWSAVIGTGVNEDDDQEGEEMDTILTRPYMFGGTTFHLDRFLKFNSIGLLCVILWGGMDNMFNASRLLLMQGWPDANLARGWWNVFFWIVANAVLVGTRTMSNQFGGDYYSSAVVTREEEE